MKKKSVVLFSVALALFVLFAAFTVLVAFCDTAVITYASEEQAEIGFAGINQAVFQAIGENALWYDFTEFLGVIALAVAALFALVGFYQLVKSRRLGSVDREILLLAALYVLVVLFYILFELIIINYRPVLIDGELEASYPSSHTMLATCIFVSAPFACKHMIKNSLTHAVVSLLCFVFALLTVIGRLLSGVHWLTDIIGALLLSASLILLYLAALALLNETAPCQKHRSHK